MKSEDWIVLSLIAVGIYLLTRNSSDTTTATQSTSSATISQISEGLGLMDIFANAMFV